MVLVSPGVSVSVIDESFYASSGPGTVPLIVIATQQDKTDPSGTAVAEGTLKDNAGKLYLATSQRELTQYFGNPNFVSIGGTSRHAYELNEYGLLAGHSYLGIANRAYFLRADIDLAELEPLDDAPVDPVSNGTYWLDLGDSSIALYQWETVSGTDRWVKKTVQFITDNLTSAGVPELFAPFPVGSIVMVPGDYATDDILNDEYPRSENRIYRRDASEWVLLDNSTAGIRVLFRSHTAVPSDDEILEVDPTPSNIGADYEVGDKVQMKLSTDISVTPNATFSVRVTEVDSGGEVLAFTVVSRGKDYPTLSGGETLVQVSTTGAGSGLEIDVVEASLEVGDYWIKTTSASNGTLFSVKQYDSDASSFVEVEAPLSDSRNNALLLYSNNPQNGDLFVHYDYGNENYIIGNAKAQFSLMVHNGQGHVVAQGDVEDAAPTATDVLEINGVAVTIGGITAQAAVTAITAAMYAAGIDYIEAEADSRGRLIIRNTNGTDLVLKNDTGTPIEDFGLQSTVMIADDSSSDGYVHCNWTQIEYTASVEAPSEEPAAGRLWYSTEFNVDLLRNNGIGQWDEIEEEIFLQPAEPTTASNGDIWIDTDQVDEYPVISIYSAGEWIQIDTTDQTTPDGILFRDARPDPDFGSNLGANNGGLAGYPDLDADAPDPLLYPRGMLLWNSRYSTRNVKQWVPDYTYEGNVIGDRWVTASGNKESGAPYMGRFAVKRVITEAMAATLVDNDDIRAESIFFNLIAAPGFTELVDEMVSLNYDRKLTAFVVGDTPFRLRPDGTSLQNWATNVAQSPSNDEYGLVTADTYLGMYYPSGLATSLTGEEVVVPPSHIALRTIAFNDQVAYQWFAPAGYQRGIVSNAVNVGYVNSEDEFVPVELNEGQRDVLYTNKLNPIAWRPNKGLVVFGQKTRHPVSSALDRINVVRLINYIRYQAPLIAEPFLFEPHDEITWAAVRKVFERFLEELVTLRGIYEFAVIVDSSNNTPLRIDRNELWVDLIIQPVKSIEYIFIPVRVRNTASDLSLAAP